jgi:hypothetical protein
LNFVPGRGLRYGLSFDNDPPEIVDALAHHSERDWETSVADSARKVKTSLRLAAPGAHVLKFWMADPGVVLQKLVWTSEESNRVIWDRPKASANDLALSAPGCVQRFALPAGEFTKE